MIIVDKKSQIASFDVDAQNTFTPLCPDELPVPDGTGIVAELNAQATLASVRVGSKDAHSVKARWVATDDKPTLTPLQGENMDLTWPIHAVPGTKGFELIQGLPKVTQYDYFVWKGVELDMHPYGACYHDFAKKMSTGVIEFLRQKKITTVIVGGLATDYCVKETVLELCAAEFKVIVNLAACRGITDNTIALAKTAMIKAGAVLVKNSQHLTRGITIDHHITT